MVRNPDRWKHLTKSAEEVRMTHPDTHIHARPWGQTSHLQTSGMLQQLQHKASFDNSASCSEVLEMRMKRTQIWCYGVAVSLLCFFSPFCPLSVKENAVTSHVWFERLWRLPTGLEPRQLIYGHAGERDWKGTLSSAVSSLSLSTLYPLAHSVGIFPQNSLTFHLNELYISWQAVIPN